MIQNLANGALYGDKEKYMVPLNNFLSENLDMIKQILTVLSDEKKLAKYQKRLLRESVSNEMLQRIHSDVKKNALGIKGSIKGDAAMEIKGRLQDRFLEIEHKEALKNLCDTLCNYCKEIRCLILQRRKIDKKEENGDPEKSERASQQASSLAEECKDTKEPKESLEFHLSGDNEAEKLIGKLLTAKERRLRQTSKSTAEKPNSISPRMTPKNLPPALAGDSPSPFAGIHLRKETDFTEFAQHKKKNTSENVLEVGENCAGGSVSVSAATSAHKKHKKTPSLFGRKLRRSISLTQAIKPASTSAPEQITAKEMRAKEVQSKEEVKEEESEKREEADSARKSSMAAFQEPKQEEAIALNGKSSPSSNGESLESLSLFLKSDPPKANEESLLLDIRSSTDLSLEKETNEPLSEGSARDTHEENSTEDSSRPNSMYEGVHRRSFIVDKKVDDPKSKLEKVQSHIAMVTSGRKTDPIDPKRVLRKAETLLEKGIKSSKKIDNLPSSPVEQEANTARKNRKLRHTLGKVNSIKTKKQNPAMLNQSDRTNLLLLASGSFFRKSVNLNELSEESGKK